MVVGDTSEYVYLDVGFSHPVASSASEYVYLDIITMSQLAEVYVEALAIPAATPSNLVESYVEALAVPTATPGNLIDAYIEVLTPIAVAGTFGQDPRIAALTGKALWLRAKDVAGYSGDGVGMWTDKSGSNNNGTGAGSYPTVAFATTPLGGNSVQFANAGNFTFGSVIKPLAIAKSTTPPEIATAAITGASGVGGSWVTASGDMPTWWQVQLRSAQIVTSYAITRRDDIPGRNIKDFTFQGSNDGASWTVLDTQTGITWPTPGQIQTFSFSNSTSYSYYRVNITANNGDAYTSILEITFGGATIDPVVAEIWAVIKSESTGVNGLWKWNSGNAYVGGTNGHSFYPYSSGYVVEAFGAVSPVGSFPDSVQAWHIYRVVDTGANQMTYLDGVQKSNVALSAGGGPEWGTAAWIGKTMWGGGSSAFFTGKIAEVIVRSQVSTALEAGDITNYLQAEHFIVPLTFQGWGIPL